MSALKTSTIVLFALLFFACAPSATVTEQSEENRVDSVEQEVVTTESTVDEPRFPLAEPGLFDNGKMWTFEHPPVDYFLEEYNLELTNQWVTHARMGSVRLPNCTGSFVSETGLILTNHHCTRDEVIQVTNSGENLTRDGFYAVNVSDERRIDGYYIDQLIDIRDVTEIINSTLESSEDGTSVEEIKAEIEQGIAQEYDDFVIVEVVGLYNGALYSAYVFKRYDDIRLVMVPELEVGYFGGDPDNFTYPRYVLDMAFMRAYEDDEPLQTDYWFNWSETGAEAGEAVFVVGNPGSTERLNTIAQLEYTRDVSHPTLLWLFNNFTDAVTGYLDSGADITEEEEVELQNLVFQIQNAIKAYDGGLKALQNDEIMGRRYVNENRFREKIMEDEETAEKFGDLHDSIQEIVDAKREISSNSSALFALSPGVTITSGLMQRSLIFGIIQTLMEMDDQSVMETVEFYKSMVTSTPDWDKEIERSMVNGRVQMMLDKFDDEQKSILEGLMNGKSAEEYANYIVDNSLLTSHEGSNTLLAMDDFMSDPAVEFGYEFAFFYEMINMEMFEYQGYEEELNREVGLAHFAVYGTEFPPDATFSPRLQDGRVLSYEYNGTIAPVNTTFYGMFDRHYSHGMAEPWSLPENWRNFPEDFDLSTPLNLISTNDIIGGNSGSPLLNMDLEIVGLIFDGNIESLVSDFIYNEVTSRAISVDVRGMLEALEKVYRAERIVEELTK